MLSEDNFVSCIDGPLASLPLLLSGRDSNNLTILLLQL